MCFQSCLQLFTAFYSFFTVVYSFSTVFYNFLQFFYSFLQFFLQLFTVFLQFLTVFLQFLFVKNSVVSKLKLGSAWLSFGLSFWAKKLGLACHAFHKSSALLATPCKKARLSLACSKIQKNILSLKTKNELIPKFLPIF